MKIFSWIITFIIFTAGLTSNQLTVIGIGKVGLTLALSLEKCGYSVLGVDINQGYVDALNKKNFHTNEPFLEDYIKSSQSFRATTSLNEGLSFSDVIFVFLSTTYDTPSYNFSALLELMEELSKKNIKNKHIIINSTVKPGFIENKVRPLFKDLENITISYNPPFIAQGEIVQGLRNPDMVLIGAGSEEAGIFLKDLYKKVCLNEPYFAVLSVESAEIAKMALNCYVTSKVSFANLIGDIADNTPGAKKSDILNAIGRDSRIGLKYFKPGYGFGGPCFTRDNRAFIEYVDSINMDSSFFSTVDRVNQDHSKFMANQFIEQNLDYYLFEDLSYKENCPVKIIEGSQKLNVARIVAESGKIVVLKDNQDVLDQIRSMYGELFIYENK